MFTKKDIFMQLEEMGVPRNRPVTIHTSLRRIGEVEGRGQGLLDALIEYVTADGRLLCVPTHTHGRLYNDNIITLDFLHPQVFFQVVVGTVGHGLELDVFRTDSTGGAHFFFAS